MAALTFPLPDDNDLRSLYHEVMVSYEKIIDILIEYDGIESIDAYINQRQIICNLFYMLVNHWLCPALPIPADIPTFPIGGYET